MFNLISLFCRHESDLVIKAYAPPMETPSMHHDFLSTSEDERYYRGFVTMLLACRKCGVTSEHELLGQEAK